MVPKMQGIEVKWQRCGSDNHPCNLVRLELTKLTRVGVYFIYKPGNLGYPPTTIRVGQGIIGDRLGKHRNDYQIMQYGNDLLVTFAYPNSAHLDGVERYLKERYRPLVGERWPDVPPIAVNSPI